jgi:hypothetical protein
MIPQQNQMNMKDQKNGSSILQNDIVFFRVVSGEMK